MKKTSIQYNISNIAIFNEVFGNWPNFNKLLAKGPDSVKQFLYEDWAYIKKTLTDNPELEVVDADKEVTVDDFDVTFNKTKNGTPVFFITFPDHKFNDASSKYVALALTKTKPRYFTLEYSYNHFDNKECWVIGEFYLEGKNKTHKNYGPVDNMRLSWFAGYILGMLEGEGE